MSRWNIQTRLRAIALAGTVATLTAPADQAVWTNLSSCSQPQQAALTDAFPSHGDRLARFVRLAWLGEFEFLGDSLRAYSLTLPRNGGIVTLTAAAWWAAALSGARGLGRRADDPAPMVSTTAGCEK